MARHNLLKSLSLYGTFVFVVGAVCLSQYHIDRNSQHRVVIEDLKYLPSGKFLKGAALSYDEIVADLLWIKAIGYFGKHAQTARDYTWLYHILDITTTLDPFSPTPYEFGGIVLGTELGDVDKSLAILKKGMANVPKHHKRYWYLPFFSAFNYMFYKGDNLTAAKFLEEATRFPQRPDYLPLLVSRLYANTDDPTLAIPFLEEMIENVSTPEMKEKLELRIKQIQIKQHILLLTTARDRFKKETGSYPQSLDVLVSYGILYKIPLEPIGGSYYISKDDNSIQTSSEVDNMELHINKGPGVPLILQGK